MSFEKKKTLAFENLMSIIVLRSFKRFFLLLKLAYFSTFMDENM